MAGNCGIVTLDNIARCFGNALPHTYQEHALAQKLICRKLAGMLRDSKELQYQSVLEIGCGTGNLTRWLKEMCIIRQWTLNDLCPDCKKMVSSLLSGEKWQFRAGDASRMDFEGSFDLIASASVFQWIADLGSFICKLHGLLNAGGVLLFNSFLPSNLYEIVELTGKGLSYPGGNAVRNMLSKYFRVEDFQSEDIVLTFNSPKEVLEHMKQTGVNATGGELWTPGKLKRFCKAYEERFSENGKVSLTYRPYYVLAKRK